MYRNYRVIGSRFILRASLQSTATAMGGDGGTGQVAIWPSQLGTAVTAFSDAMGQPYCKWADVTAAKPLVLELQMKTSKITGIKAVEGSDQLQALISSTPAKEWFWNYGFTCGAAYSNTSLELDFQVTYDVEFFSRSQLDRSTFLAKAMRQAYLAHVSLILAEQKEADAQQSKRSERQRELLKESKQLDGKEFKSSGLKLEADPDDPEDDYLFLKFKQTLLGKKEEPQTPAGKQPGKELESLKRK
jgi:hypothetical protein